MQSITLLAFACALVHVAAFGNFDVETKFAIAHGISYFSAQLWSCYESTIRTPNVRQDSAKEG